MPRLIFPMSALVFGLLASATPFSASAEPELIDDFEDGDDAGWIHIDLLEGTSFGPTIYTVENGSYCIRSSAPLPFISVFVGTGALWELSTVDTRYSNGFVRAAVTPSNEMSLIDVPMRVTPCTPSGLAGYNFYLDHSQTAIGISRLNCDGTVDEFSDAFFFSEPGFTYVLEAGAVGTALTLRAWALGAPEPNTPQVAVFDATHSQGAFGLAVYNNAFANGEQLDACFDDVVFTPPPCIGDVDTDGDVDLQDLAFVLAHFGIACHPQACGEDLDGDADVDLQDLALLLSRFGSSCP